MRLVCITLVLIGIARPAQAFNALGHKVIADIAWTELAPETRQQIVATLRRHPRFDEDFAKQLPADVADDADDRWIFQQAAVWPDLCRGFKGEDRSTYDHPTWHYVNHPLFVGGERPLLGVNLSNDYPPLLDQSKWNVCQAVKHCQATLNSNAPPSDKALAYCWLFHLVGDLHQPLHSTALFSERFPTGDRGGNLIKTVQGENLHSLWDGLLGKQHRPNDVKREVAELRTQRTMWTIKTEGPVEEWIEESHGLAKSYVYSPQIIEAVQQPGELQKINFTKEYLTGAGELARERIVAAGLRLGALLKASPGSRAGARPVAGFAPERPLQSAPKSRPAATAPSPSSAPSAMGYWLNLNGNVRHNTSCKFYENTKRGRACSAVEGKACGICGG